MHVLTYLRHSAANFLSKAGRTQDETRRRHLIMMATNCQALMAQHEDQSLVSGSDRRRPRSEPKSAV